MCLLIIVAVPVFFTLWFCFSTILGGVGIPGDIAAGLGAAIAAAVMFGMLRWVWRYAGHRVTAMKDQIRDDEPSRPGGAS